MTFTADAATDPRELAHLSHDLIAAHQDEGGAYPAAPDFSAYRGYAWLRDGSFVAEGMSRFGDIESADRFHDWVARTLVGRADQVADLIGRSAAGDVPPDREMLPTRYRLDGSDGTDPWWDFQLDGYGTWLWSVATHVRRHGRDASRWIPAAELVVDYLAAFWRRSCYDWWEEHAEHRHVSTLGAVVGGLEAMAPLLDPRRSGSASRSAREARAAVLARGTTHGRATESDEIHLAKWFGATAVDASLAACVVPYGVIDPGEPLARATIDAIVRDLDVGGGVHRFADDVFYGGGQWPLLSCLIGWNRAVMGDRDGAMAHLVWAAGCADRHGNLPEQVPDHLLHPTHRDEWVSRWGQVASPLLWSHGMYLILSDVLGVVR